MGYVTKEKNHLETADSSENQCSDYNATNEFYRVFIVELTIDDTKVHNLEMKRSKQVRIQFLYREKEQLDVDKFLVLIHHECKSILFNISNHSYCICIQILIELFKVF
jgi:hypothetical protein